MFSKTAIFAFVLAAGLTTTANAQTTTTKMTTKSSKSEASTTAAATTNAKSSARSSKTLVAAPAKGESVTIVQLNSLNLNANSSLSSQVLHPVAGRSVFQAVPKSNSLTVERKFDGQKAVESTIRTNAVGVEFALGLSNDYSLNFSTDMGTDGVKPKKETETTNVGFSDLKVELRKMNQQDMQQTFMAGFFTTSLGEAAEGNVSGGKNIDGNRFSGGMTLGGAYTKQTAALDSNFGYKMSAALQFNRKVDIKQSTQIYSAYEISGGHILRAEAFGERMLGQATKIGGAIGMNVTLPQDGTIREGATRVSASSGQLNIMSIKAFAAMNAGQLEFIPTAVFERNLGNSGGKFSTESHENVGIELITRFSL